MYDRNKKLKLVKQISFQTHIRDELTMNYLTVERIGRKPWILE